MRLLESKPMITLGQKVYSWKVTPPAARPPIPVEQRPMPTLAQVVTYGRARLFGKLVPDAVRMAREAICLTCDHVRQDADGALWCSRCTCGVSSAERLVRNLAAYEERLPLWGCKHPERSKGKGWPTSTIYARKTDRITGS